MSRGAPFEYAPGTCRFGVGVMLSFVYQVLPARVIFGAGCLERLPDEIKRLGAGRALVLSTPEQRNGVLALVERLGEYAVGLFDRAAMHVPVETAHAAREEANRLGADCCLAIGGGSTTGLAKAIALVSDLPILAVPTTYAGSEMTPIWGLTEKGRKTTGRDPRVLPKTVLYDPHLTLTMPPSLSATSGMNSIAHCVEALYAQEVNPGGRRMRKQRQTETSRPALRAPELLSRNPLRTTKVQKSALGFPVD